MSLASSRLALALSLACAPRGVAKPPGPRFHLPGKGGKAQRSFFEPQATACAQAHASTQWHSTRLVRGGRVGGVGADVGRGGKRVSRSTAHAMAAALAVGKAGVPSAALEGLSAESALVLERNYQRLALAVERVAGGGALRGAARSLARAWIARLSAPMQDAGEKRTRNSHARALLEQLERGTLERPFNVSPPAPHEPLPVVVGGAASRATSAGSTRMRASIAHHALNDTSVWGIGSRGDGGGVGTLTLRDGSGGALVPRATASHSRTVSHVAAMSDTQANLVVSMGERLGASAEALAELKWRCKLAEERLGDVQALMDRAEAERDSLAEALREARERGEREREAAITACEQRHARVVDELERAADAKLRAVEEKYACAVAAAQEDHTEAMRRMKAQHCAAIDELVEKYNELLLKQTGFRSKVSSAELAGEGKLAEQQIEQQGVLVAAAAGVAKAATEAAAGLVVPLTKSLPVSELPPRLELASRSPPRPRASSRSAAVGAPRTSKSSRLAAAIRAVQIVASSPKTRAQDSPEHSARSPAAATLAPESPALADLPGESAAADADLAEMLEGFRARTLSLQEKAGGAARDAAITEAQRARAALQQALED